MSSEQNVLALRRLIEEGFTGGDLSVVDEVVAPRCVEHQARLGAGPEGVKEAIRTLHRWFSEFELRIEHVVAQDDLVWAHALGGGVHTGTIMGTPASGVRTSIDVFDLCRFEDGRIVEHWGVPDQLTMLMQVGAIPGREAVAGRAEG